MLQTGELRPREIQLLKERVDTCQDYIVVQIVNSYWSPYSRKQTLGLFTLGPPMFSQVPSYTTADKTKRLFLSSCSRWARLLHISSS